MGCLVCVAWALTLSTVAAQGGAGVSGHWRAVEAAMGQGGPAVSSPRQAERRPATPRPAVTRDLIIVDRIDLVEVERARNGAPVRWSLPLSGVTVPVADGDVTGVEARAFREGPVLVVRSAQQVRLPGGESVLVEVEERHVLLADGTLRVETVSRAGARTQSHQTRYRRVE